MGARLLSPARDILAHCCRALTRDLYLRVGTIFTRNLWLRGAHILVESPPQWGNASSSSSASSSSFTMQGGAAHMKGAAQMLMVTTTTFRSSASKPAKPSSQNSRPSQALPPYKPAPSVGYAAPPTAAPASKTLDSSDDEATAPPQYSQRGTPPPRGNTPNAPIPPGVCIIPGCGQQVYKGSSGPSRFCSRGHGECVHCSSIWTNAQSRRRFCKGRQ